MAVIKNEEKTKEELLKELSEAREQIARMESVSDIAERKRLEMEELKTEKLESLGILAASIAHEYNNVLTAISGNIALAKMYAKAGSEMADILYESEKASQKAEKLTQQLLIFSSGRVLFKKVMKVTDMLTNLTTVKENSDIRYELSLDSNLWPIEADEGQIRHAVKNIIENAKEAMSGRGVIRIHAENTDTVPASIPSMKEGKYLKISVSDQGEGIDETCIENIFEPFFTTKQKRSGLGLTASFSIIQNHAGYITAESSAGAGTTFHIYIPAVSESSQQTDNGKRVSIDRRNILVMDDDELVSNVLERMLDQCSCAATFSKNGEELLTKYREAMESGHPFDAVIIDLIISSGMNGKDAIKKLRELDPHARAVVSSGYSDDPIMANFRDYGFMGALPKPYNIPALSKVLHDVIMGTE